MNRTVRMIAAAALGLGCLLGAGAAPAATDALPLILKQRTLVGGDGIRLSDVFANVPAENDGRIADSPAPGDRLVFSARQLFHYAKSFGLSWRPNDMREYAEVTRDSMPIPVEMVREALATALERENIGDDFDVEIYNRDVPLFVATGDRPTVIVRTLVFDPRSRRFDASVALAGAEAKSVVVNGRVAAMVSVPVLRNHAMPGDVITENDVRWSRVEARRAGPNTVSQLADLVGRTPRRPITAGQTVRLSDLRPNYVIGKGDLVTVVLKAGTMTLTARAEALEKGAVGDVIRVRNNHSRKVLETRVIAADTVTVTAAQIASIN
ncbi:hypothetical protein GCM10017083_47660 [Thalassobaculum fulvum]|jgi:flagella basal body P-ring formation protein FlgA|uniref:SAF domain-containing protein n=1 Tax=Thalassobaculum fulvum TaxID=1633335 RepID=A0A918XW83_9PROT|nr:flagellar basal body P-ring formation chaperone FlgA [Thalassobaculum fulvum]GHD60949.1 hypothetical protein GCM10017083_47660 [Thalassobaculum fulvum]